MKQIAFNRRALVEYDILEKYEAGIVLTGEEIKAIRQNRANLAGAFCRVSNSEAWVLNMHIANTKEPERSRKLLLHKNEIRSLIGKTQQKGLTLIALSLYIKKNHAKLEIGLARGKKLYDHREELKKRDINRQTERELKD
ncbi:MAG: smpB [Candidatus Berkelbacteria bacterium]|nr:smpB [Candidatus Berkelbacteria bacterium]